MVEDAKAAKQRRLAEALRANLKRRKAAARGRSPGKASEVARPEGAASAAGRSETGGGKG